MKLNAQRKAYLGVFGVAVAGLVTDRMIGYGPGPQEASAVSPSAAGSSSGSRAAAVAAAGVGDSSARGAAGATVRETRGARAIGDVISVAAQLDALVSDGAQATGERGTPAASSVSALAAVDEVIPDAFELPSGVLAVIAIAPAPEREAAGGVTAGPSGEPSVTPVERLKLTGIVRYADAGQSVAVIDGRPVRIGMEIGGWSVLEIAADGAVLEAPDGVRARLELSEPVLGAGTRR